MSPAANSKSLLVVSLLRHVVHSVPAEILHLIMSSDIVIISCLSDDDDDVNGSGSSSQKENFLNSHDGAVNNNSSANGNNGDANPKVSVSPSKEGAAFDNDDDDDIEVVDSSAYRSQIQSASASAMADGGGVAAACNDNDEELEIVGTQNEQKLPHIRHDCLEFRYNANCNIAGGGSGSENNNEAFCGLCYCYVCDKPASKCDNWFMGGKGICSDTATAGNTDGKAKDDGENIKNNTEPHKNHCNATDKGSQSQLWKNMRKAIKDGKDPSQVSNARESAVEGTSDTQEQLRQYLANYSNITSGGGSNQRSRIHATAQGGARRGRSFGGGGGAGAFASNASAYGSTTYAAAAGASLPASLGGRSRSAGGRRSARSSGTKRPAPHDHRARIRTQRMLEDLYK